MGLRINTNVLSLTAQRNLISTSKALGKSLERLASGSRINRAGDDAAGLAISEGLNSQVRGVRVAIRNANDAIGFLNTAEGALSEATNITQRLRELAIQAANGTLGDVDRGYLDAEASQLLSEFARITAQTEFNGVKLLDGSFTTTELQVGVNRGESVEFNIGDARASSLGSIASKSGVQHYILSSAAGLTVNGVAIAAPAAGDDTVSSAGNGWSAIAVAAAINNKSNETDVQAVVLDNVVDIYDLTMTNWDGTFSASEFVINGTSITGTGVNTVGGLIDAINNKAAATGVRARLMASGYGSASSGNDIQLYSEDGRNIQVGVMSALVTTAVSTDFVNVFAGTMTGTLNVNSANLSAFLTGVSGTSTLLISGYARTFTGAIKLVSAENISFAAVGASLTVGFSGTSFVVDEDLSLEDVDISDQDAAADALDLIDQTLSELNSLRADLGAVQNRLESTINNLSITLENISSARSQIRDADIAAETAELTRAQILQQAGVAVLGQANTSSQVALALLQF